MMPLLELENEFFKKAQTLVSNFMSVKIIIKLDEV